MRKSLFALPLLLFVSCGPKADPAYVRTNGNLSAFIEKQLLDNGSDLYRTNSFKSLDTAWSHRTIRSQHKPGGYLDGRQRVEIQTSQENYEPLKRILSDALGKPTYVLAVANPDDNTNNHPRWCSIEGGARIWLSKMKTNCLMQIEVNE